MHAECAPVGVLPPARRFLAHRKLHARHMRARAVSDGAHAQGCVSRTRLGRTIVSSECITAGRWSADRMCNHAAVQSAEPITV